MKEFANTYFHFAIFLDEKDFNYIKARKDIDIIHKKIGSNCLEFVSNNDEFIVIKTTLTLRNIKSKLTEISCKIHAIGNKTQIAIDAPVLKTTNKNSHFVIFTKALDSKEAKKTINRIYKKIGFSCVQVAIFQNKALYIESLFDLAEMAHALKGENCKIQFIGEKTEIAIDSIFQN